jgi:hypothetical protein
VQHVRQVRDQSVEDGVHGRLAPEVVVVVEHDDQLLADLL